MAPAPKRLSFTREDFPGAPAWMEKLLDGLNPFAQQVVQALSKGLTPSENSACEVKTVSFTAPAPVWTAPTLENNWVNYGGGFDSAGFRILPGGDVWAKGLVKDGTINTRVFAWPTGYAPSLSHIFATDTSTGYGRLDARTDGVYAVTGGTGNVSLACRFQAAATCAPPVPPAAPWPLSVQHGLPEVSEVRALKTRCIDATALELVGAPSFEWVAGHESNVLLRNVWGLVPGRRYEVSLLLQSG